MSEQPLQFKYSAMALFRHVKAGYTELRVVLFEAENVTEALREAEHSMHLYAKEFECEYSGTVNVNEYGSDLFADFGEVFSTTWKTDDAFDSALDDRLGE